MMAALSVTLVCMSEAGRAMLVRSGEKEVVNMKKIMSKKAMSAIEAVGTIGAIRLILYRMVYHSKCHLRLNGVTFATIFQPR